MKPAFLYLVVMWLLELIDQTFLSEGLDYFGIRPHRTDWLGAIGIVTCPFLHNGFSHLRGNTLWYIPLAILVLLKTQGRFNEIFWTIATIDGVGVWLIGNPGTNHIGASGIVFGMFGFLVFRCLFRFDYISIFAAALVLSRLEGVLWGMHPVMEFFNISWEGHMMGFIAGCVLGCFDLESS